MLQPLQLEKPVLSPISDRSFLTAADATVSPRLDASEEEFILAQSSLTVGRSARVWLHPTPSEERIGRGPDDSGRKVERAPQEEPKADLSIGQSAMQVENKAFNTDRRPSNASEAFAAEDAPITEDDRLIARQIFDGDESFVTKAAAASWLGQTNAAKSRMAYMECFDWAGINILSAFRELCSRLVVRAESQQLDRVIDAFSERWCECNPYHGFKDRDVVHTIAFSILMLNTDLHLAELEQHMTRSQFVKNTLPTIRNIADAAVDNDAKGKDQALASPVSPHTPLERPSLDLVINKNRMSKFSGARSESEGNAESSDKLLVTAPYDGTMRGWEAQVETVLKDFYNSIRSERLPLHGAPEDRGRQASNASLSVVNIALRRTPSVLSKAPSENASFRGRPHEMRSATARFASKSRTRPRVYPSSTMGSSRTSLDDQSLWSPAASTWTKYSLGKTQTSFSAESLGSWRGSGFPQAIGFANAISQAIIREENKEGLLSPTDQADFGGRTVALLEDDTLELHGPPWAKEGSLRHKVQDKRTKDRGWTECFAVIEKGCMRMFSFTGTQGHSTVKGALRHLRPQKHKPAGSASGNVVGGGNWTENAQDLGSFTLRQTYATSFAREHSKSQACVWALTLPTGVVHAFAVGSPELREEWTATVNYWSARLSKEPLIGGVSNVEYGWGDALLATVRDADGPLASPPPTSNSAGGAREGPPSTSASATMYSAASRAGSRSNSVSNNAPQLPENLALHSRTSLPHSTSVGSRPPSSLGRASLDQASSHGGGHRAGRLPGDRAAVSDWRPPVSSMMESQLMEVDQRNALAAYVGELEVELKKHAELRGTMGRAVCVLLLLEDTDCLVLTAPPERGEGDEQLEQQEQLPAHGDLQVHDVHRGAEPRGKGQVQDRRRAGRRGRGRACAQAVVCERRGRAASGAKGRG
jgi:hypothetical protein